MIKKHMFCDLCFKEIPADIGESGSYICIELLYRKELKNICDNCNEQLCKFIMKIQGVAKPDDIKHGGQDV